tara:strand:+ start:2053 stop:2253 length:201 start_codon:yes stop_codon:yes gene_type:complete
MNQTDLHTLLPIEAQLLLRRAASTPITKGDPQSRRRAIDSAIEKVKRDYPEYFQQPEGEVIANQNY